MKKKVKKAMSMLLVAALTAGISISGTMAYLTSEDSDLNVMTLGNVKIKQHEYERVEKAIATCVAQVFVHGELAASGEVTLAMR